MKKSRLLGVMFTCLLSCAIHINAAPVVGPTGNAYEYVSDWITSWSDASIAAENSSYMGLSGHLAAVTSQAENDFLVSLIPDVRGAVWLGGFDASGDYSDPAKDNWSWVTGEPFVYSNWQETEPGANPTENYLQMYGGRVGSIIYGVAPGIWNNVVEDYTDIGNPYGLRGYIVEYEISSIPIPPGLYLFGSGLLGLIGIARRKRTH